MERKGKVKEFSYVKRPEPWGTQLCAAYSVSLVNPSWALRESYVRPSATILRFL